MITIDREKHVVHKDGELVRLTGLEYGLLAFLTSRVNRVCTRNEILDHVWGTRFHYDTGTINVHLNALRRKLGFSSKYPIETIRGVGFIYRVEHAVAHYTIDLQQFMIEWLNKHEIDLVSAGLVAQLQLTPFVNELTIEPDALERLLDNALAALLPGARPGVIKIASRLTLNSFSLTLDINGMVTELRIPVNSEIYQS